MMNAAAEYVADEGLASRQRPVILCVDDEIPILASLQRLLRDEPYEVVTTDSPQEALEWVRRRPIHVLIADQRMPGMSGTDLLKAIRETSPKTVRIMLTAYADFEVVADAVNEARIQQFIRKPWDGDALKKTIRGLLEEKREAPEDWINLSVEDEKISVSSSPGPASRPGGPRVSCRGKTVEQVMAEITRLPPLLRADDEHWIVLEDLMALDDSVTLLLSQLIRRFISWGTRVSLHVQLRRGHFGR